MMNLGLNFPLPLVFESKPLPVQQRRCDFYL